MTIEKTFCDRCGKECEKTRINYSFHIYKKLLVLANVHNYDEHLDLCQNCYDSLADWMEAGKADREVGESKKPIGTVDEVVDEVVDESVDECHFLCKWNSGLRCTKNPNERNCHKRVSREVGESE